MIRIVADHIISPSGIGTDNNFRAVLQKQSAIRLIDDRHLWPEPFYAAAFSADQISEIKQRYQNSGLTRLEILMADAIEEVCKGSGTDLKSQHTQLILATTKGNIDLLSQEMEVPGQSLLYRLGKNLQQFFGAARPVLIVSTACTSGLTAIINGARMLQAETARQVIVCGGDLLTRFTLSGFQSFKAISNKPCKPYDASRDGITLGEGVAAVAMTKTDDKGFPQYLSGATANDANHISGPSRTGEGLYQCVQRAVKAMNHVPDMISAHGTATVYNDEMEAQAFNRCGLSGVPLHSLKGIYGHTLGAAGVIETIVALRAMKENRLIPSVGYDQHGVSLPLNVTRESSESGIGSILKTSSGFGGSNAAAFFSL